MLNKITMSRYNCTPYTISLRNQMNGHKQWNGGIHSQTSRLRSLYNLVRLEITQRQSEKWEWDTLSWRGSYQSCCSCLEPFFLSLFLSLSLSLPKKATLLNMKLSSLKVPEWAETFSSLPRPLCGAAKKKRMESRVQFLFSRQFFVWKIVMYSYWRGQDIVKVHHACHS